MHVQSNPLTLGDMQLVVTARRSLNKKVDRDATSCITWVYIVTLHDAANMHARRLCDSLSPAVDTADTVTSSAVGFAWGTGAGSHGEHAAAKCAAAVLAIHVVHLRVGTL